jgi:hypothetical protein
MTVYLDFSFRIQKPEANEAERPTRLDEGAASAIEDINISASHMSKLACNGILKVVMISGWYLGR